MWTLSTTQPRHRARQHQRTVNEAMAALLAESWRRRRMTSQRWLALCELYPVGATRAPPRRHPPNRRETQPCRECHVSRVLYGTVSSVSPPRCVRRDDRLRSSPLPDVVTSFRVQRRGFRVLSWPLRTNFSIVIELNASSRCCSVALWSAYPLRACNWAHLQSYKSPYPAHQSKTPFSDHGKYNCWEIDGNKLCK